MRHAGAGLQGVPSGAVGGSHGDGGIGADGTRGGSGQGGQVDHEFGLVLFGVVQRVGQDQATLGVGVEHLYGDSV